MRQIAEEHGIGHFGGSFPSGYSWPMFVACCYLKGWCLLSLCPISAAARAAFGTMVLADKLALNPSQLEI